MKLNTLLSLLLVVASVSTPSLFAFQGKYRGAEAITAAQWREDLRFFADELPKRHKNLFHTMTRAQFDSAVKHLDGQIPTLAGHEIAVEFMRITALIRDGHTGVMPFNVFGAGAYPLRFYLFKDGLFVRQAAPEWGELAGAKVLRIGNTSAEEALGKVRDLIARDNEMGVKHTGPVLLSIPEILHALKLTADLQTLKLRVELGGKQKDLDIKPTAKLNDLFQVPVNWTDASAQAQTPPPLWAKDPSNWYWFEYLPAARTVYVQFRAVENNPEETVAAFFNRVFDFVAANRVDKLALDLRFNDGGNNGLIRPIVIGLIKSKVNEHGKLFAFIGRQTFSAAQNTVNELEKYTNVIFVGEPTGGRPNHYGDARPFTLPNSGMVIRASSVWWQDMPPFDQRNWTAPDISAEFAASDYRNNQDPALQAVLDYKPGQDFNVIVTEALPEGNFATFLQKYRQFKDEPANEYTNTESALNGLGYQLLQRNRPNEAIAVFKLNVEAYPKSANAFDSLGEAYLNQGNRAEAIASYEKALAIDPDFLSAKTALQKLKNR
jgi:tetratricopeptide (TPR) repeat protein